MNKDAIINIFKYNIKRLEYTEERRCNLSKDERELLTALKDSIELIK